LTTMEMKRCSKCKLEFPKTSEYFAPDKRTPSGFSYLCRSCIRATKRAYKQTPKGKATEKRYSESAKAKAVRRVYKQTPKGKATEKRYSESAKAKAARKASRISPKGKAQKRLYLSSPEGIAVTLAYNRSANAKVAQRNYRQSPRGKLVILQRNMRRRTRKQELPFDYTIDDQTNMILYFGSTCAVCGRTILPDNPTLKLVADHWITLSDLRPNNPGTVPWNIVPLCHGTGGCNNSKKDKNPVEWLRERFGDEAEIILLRISSYFIWVRWARELDAQAWAFQAPDE
jgi:hypothetical protein